MGTISSFPITTIKIEELPIYGAIDKSMSRKDLFEVSKNEGTYDTPVYASDGSRKITGEQIIATLGIGKSKEVVVVQVLDTPPLHTEDTITDVEILPEHDNYHFRLEYISRIYTDKYFGAFNLLLPVEPRNGFSFLATFDTNGASTNDFDDQTFSSGFTYQITYSSTDERWIYTKQDNISDHRPAYVFNDQNDTSQNAYEAGQTYYINWAPSTPTQNYIIELPLLRLSAGQKITFILNKDFGDEFDETERPVSFRPQTDAVTSVDDVIIGANDGAAFYPPPLCKRGSSWTFTPIYDNVATSESGSPTTMEFGWFLESKIIL